MFVTGFYLFWSRYDGKQTELGAMEMIWIPPIIHNYIPLKSANVLLINRSKYWSASYGKADNAIIVLIANMKMKLNDQFLLQNVNEYRVLKLYPFKFIYGSRI